MKNRGIVVVALVLLSIVVAVPLAYMAFGSSDPTTSGSAMGLIVFYTDGSYDTFKGQGSLDSSQLAILAGSKEISYIQLVVEGTITGPALSGVTAWSSATALQLELYPSGSATPAMSSTADYPKSGGVWSSGETQILASYTLYAVDLENVLMQYGESGWYMQANANTQVTLQKSGGTLTLAGTAFAGMSIQYTQNTPTVLSVVVGSTPFMAIK